MLLAYLHEAVCDNARKYFLSNFYWYSAFINIVDNSKTKDLTTDFEAKLLLQYIRISFKFHICLRIYYYSR